MSRTKRRPYTGAKAIDPACRRGDCPHCLGQKMHKHNKKLNSLKEDLEENGYFRFWK